MDFYSLVRPFLFMLPPEQAHALALGVLRRCLVGSSQGGNYPLLKCNVWGLSFPTPIGLAAGFDKNAECLHGLQKLGFGFLEAGTVTPKPQSGNPRPRIFRLWEDEALINRLGFNNRGAAYASMQLRRRPAGIIGCNIGKNKDSTDAIADYTYMLEQLYGFSDYITVNISSPNTPGLRALEQGEALSELMHALYETRGYLTKLHGFQVPILVKLSPDMPFSMLEHTLLTLKSHKVEGIILTNTTTQERESLQSKHRKETGGLSGKPLASRALQVLRYSYQMTGGSIPLIGVGGITSGRDVYERIRAGATLVQLYTALIYQGPGLITRLTQELHAYVKGDGFASIQEAVGVDSRAGS